MSRLLRMVGKDLLRKRRAPLSVVAVLSFPLVFAGLLALTFGGGEPEMPRVHLLVEDRDASTLSGLLVAALGSPAAARWVEIDEVGPEGTARIESGEASALLRIPQGFGESLLAGEPVTLDLVRNPAQGILPEIAEQGLGVIVEGLSSASTLLRGPLDELRPLLDAPEPPSESQVAGIAVAFQRAIRGPAEVLLPPRITLTSARERNAHGAGAPGGGPPGTGTIFLWVLPGISVWALFLLGEIAMRDILTETKDGTLRRQLCAPLTASGIVAAKALFTAVLSVVSMILLAGIGWAAAGRAVDPAGFVTLSAAVTLAVTGFAAVVYGFARTERQGATVANVLLLAFAFLGGSFVQVQSLPAAARRLSPLSPIYWGTTGYAELIRDGAGVVEILPNAAVLAGAGSVLLIAGSALLRRRLGRDMVA